MSAALVNTDSKLVEPYFPLQAEIVDVRRFTELETFYRIRLPGGQELGHQPGQFVMVSLLGVGEAPISISSSPTQRGTFDLCVRRVGMLTEVLAGYRPGMKVGIRGPLGKGFDVEAFRGKDILIIGGGIGIVPLRSLINYVIDRRPDFGRLIILYGARSPRELLYPEERRLWEEHPEIEYHVTVDRGDEGWTGKTGVITTLIPLLELEQARTMACIVGPPVMYKFVLMALKARRFPEESIYVSLERRMKCGVGKCGHCQINDLYCCCDGPVFCYPEVVGRKEAF
ncbi:MAG: oxidoreductase [Deltaproteobacteria bacterium]|nr:oxidoreductase [Deltaproteobacteria bacterium]